MRTPSLDKLHPGTLKLKYSFGLLVLPLLLGVATSYPVYLIPQEILPLIGVNPEAPLGEQRRDGIAILILLVVVLAGFIIGCFIGFFANAGFCRYVLRWDKKKVEAVFYESKVPDSWRVSR